MNLLVSSLTLLCSHYYMYMVIYLLLLPLGIVDTPYYLPRYTTLVPHISYGWLPSLVHPTLSLYLPSYPCSHSRKVVMPLLVWLTLLLYPFSQLFSHLGKMSSKFLIPLHCHFVRLVNLAPTRGKLSCPCYST
jgi:hypothetical protein